jgi:hypothetical protein
LPLTGVNVGIVVGSVGKVVANGATVTAVARGGGVRVRNWCIQNNSEGLELQAN